MEPSFLDPTSAPSRHVSRSKRGLSKQLVMYGSSKAAEQLPPFECMEFTGKPSFQNSSRCEQLSLKVLAATCFQLLAGHLLEAEASSMIPDVSLAHMVQVHDIQGLWSQIQIESIAFGTRVLKHWVLLPSGLAMSTSISISEVSVPISTSISLTISTLTLISVSWFH